MTRAAAVARAIGLAREHIADYVRDASIKVDRSREPKTALGGGARLVVTLTVVVDDPDAPIDETAAWISGDFAIGDDRSQP